MEKKVIVCISQKIRFYYPNWSICWKIRFHYTKQLLFLAKQSKMVSLYGETASSSGKKNRKWFHYMEKLLLLAKKSKMVSTMRKNCFFWQKSRKWFPLAGKTASSVKKSKMVTTSKKKIFCWNWFPLISFMTSNSRKSLRAKAYCCH